MHQRLRTLLASLLAVSATSLAAQNPGAPGSNAAQQPAFEIRGRVTDTANTPLPRAAISLRLKGSPTTIAGAIAGPDGSFRVIGLRAATFQIRVALIGYSPVIQEITLKPSAPTLDLGAAKLAPLPTKLAGVTVTEERDVMTTAPDRNAYRAKDIAPGAANASELLENVPSVQVDVDGKVSLRGNENVVVQVNGRPTPMRGAQLAAYLKSVPANMIDRIEVIPNPSAKYDPEGMAGIINVALKSNVDLGLSGSVNTAVSNADRYNGSGNIGYQAGPWTSFVSAGVVADKRTSAGLNDRARFGDDNALLGTTAQDIALAPSMNGRNFSATVDYKLSPRDVLSNALIVNRRTSGEVSATTQSLLDASGRTTSSFRMPRNTDSKGLMIDYDLALKHTFAPRTHELSGELRFNRAHDEDVFDERQIASSGIGYVNGRIDDNDAVTKQLTGQVDYVKTLRPRMKLETGWKSNARWLDRDYRVTTDASGTGTWGASPLSNALAFDEAVHAIYAVVSQGVDKWDLSAGLRGEYADRTFSLSTQKYPFEYASLFPSAGASYSIDQSTQLKANYSRRIRRPGSQELNPFPTYFDADNIFLGNPNLSPEYTDALELGLNKQGSKGQVQLSPFFRHTSNVIRIGFSTGDTVNGREVQTISFRNLAKSDSWGTDLTGQLRLSKRFTALTNATVYKAVTEAGSSTTAVGSNAIGWNARTAVTSELTSKLTVQGVYNYRAPLKIEGGEYGAQQNAAFALRYKVQNDQGALLFRVADPFETLRFRITTNQGRVVQLTERNPASRMMMFGYQYSFGRPPRMREVGPQETGGGSVGFGGATPPA